jgi:hypothetical protein
MLTVHLEETDCFAAWVSAKEVGMGQSNDGLDPKCESWEYFYIAICKCFVLLRLTIYTIRRTALASSTGIRMHHAGTIICRDQYFDE